MAVLYQPIAVGVLSAVGQLLPSGLHARLAPVQNDGYFIDDNKAIRQPAKRKAQMRNVKISNLFIWDHPGFRPGGWMKLRVWG